MRSLSSKLILAFLVISLFSGGIIVVYTRTATNREFNKFINNQYRASLAQQLGRYYQDHGTWVGIEKTFTSPDHPNDNRPLFFSIIDPNGVVSVAGFNHTVGETVNEDYLETGTPITVQNETIGFLLLNTPPQTRSPIEEDFLRRLSTSILYSAVGTILLAFIIGILLSRSLSKPIRELTKATHEMASGNLHQQVPVRSRDEIGELAASFNKMSSDLARSFNLRKQMTADIAHELRTPLSLIIGHAEAVHDGVLEPSRENFEIIREEAERLEQLVNDLRTLSLADAGELSVDFQPLDINVLLSDVQNHYAHQFNQKHIALDFEPASGVFKANLDPVRFSQVLTNILNNALHYTPEGGGVLIKTGQIMDELEIAIQDSGIGVSPEQASHLFDRFYRADPSRTRDDGGSGLGLAIAKSIIEMHDGRIWAESETGKGLKVYIRLPALDG